MDLIDLYNLNYYYNYCKHMSYYIMFNLYMYSYMLNLVKYSYLLNLNSYLFRTLLIIWTLLWNPLI